MVARRPNPRRRMPRADERGSALVLAVVILFAMLGLGMLAMRSTTQNIAGSGVLRMEKQARYVAENGLFHFTSVLNNGAGDDVLSYFQAQKAANPLVLAVEMDSNGNARVLVENPQGALVPVGGDNPRWQAIRPGNMAAARQPLGPFAGGLVPSYRVRAEGFTLGRVDNDTGTADCLVHLTSTGYIWTAALPTQAQIQAAAQAGNTSLFAEQQMKAAVQISNIRKDLCDS